MNALKTILTLAALAVLATSCLSLPQAPSSSDVEIVPDDRASISASKLRDGQTLMVAGMIRSRTGRGGVTKGHIHLTALDQDGTLLSEVVKHHPALSMRRRAPRQIRFSARLPDVPLDARVRVERHSGSCETVAAR